MAIFEIQIPSSDSDRTIDFIKYHDTVCGLFKYDENTDFPFATTEEVYTRYISNTIKLIQKSIHFRFKVMIWKGHFIQRNEKTINK